MKVLILANNSGGLYDFRHQLIEKVSQHAEIFAATPFDDKVNELKSLGIELLDTPVDRRGINPFRDLRLFCTYLHLLRRIRPDLVITYTIKPNVYGGLACRLRRVPYAANITGLGTAFQKDGMLKKLVARMYRIGLKRAKVVFFENCGNLRVFTELGIVPEEKTCLLNGAGVDLDYFQSAEYPAGEVTRFLFIGRLMREKGVDELLSAVGDLAREGLPVHLDVVGSPEEDYREILARYQTEGWLTYHGYQSDVRPFIAAAHCFVLPSWHEGMANTNLECAASARPVITSRIHGCMEAVEECVSGYLVRPRDPEDLKRVLREFISLPPDARRAMGLAGRERMKTMFDKQQVVGKTMERLSDWD